MQVAAELHRDLVLVGGGHSHALALRMLAMNPVAGLRITLVSPFSHTPYSGMLPGYLAGTYGFRECHVDLAPLCQFAQARLLHAAATGIDLAERLVHCQGRPPVPFDLLSIDTGSTPGVSAIDGALSPTRRR